MSFNDKGYEVVRGIINEQTLKLLATEFELLRDNQFWYRGLTDKFAFGDPQVPESFSQYAPLCFESLMIILRDKIAEVTGKNLEPAYSYARIYYKGNTLDKHTDRESCQYSATICIENDKEPWPIYMEDWKGNVNSVDLYPGDMIVYRGDKLNHWREKYNGDKQIQCFIHYVDIDDKYKDFINDRRPMLGLCETTRKNIAK